MKKSKLIEILNESGISKLFLNGRNENEEYKITMNNNDNNGIISVNIDDNDYQLCEFSNKQAVLAAMRNQYKNSKKS